MRTSRLSAFCVILCVSAELSFPRPAVARPRRRGRRQTPSSPRPKSSRKPGWKPSSTRPPLDLSAQAAQGRRRAPRRPAARAQRDAHRQLSATHAPPKSTPCSRNFRQEHFTDARRIPRRAEKYGVTEDQLKDHLSWQLSAIRFTDLRFGRSPASSRAPPTGADRARRAAKGDVDQQMDAWLKADARRHQSAIQTRGFQ